MFFQQVALGPMQNFAYIIADESTKQAAVVDPAFEENKLYDIAQKHGFTIKKILLTHTHMDHIEAVPRVVAKTNATIYVHKSGQSAVSLPSQAINESSELKIGSIPIKIIETPGHSPSNVCFIIEKNILTGDTLFIGRCGRYDFADSDPNKMFESLQKLKQLPDDLEVYPGHDYGHIPHDSLGNQKKNNEAMQMSKADFTNF